jgi:hypothetical protein
LFIILQKGGKFVLSGENDSGNNKGTIFSNCTLPIPSSSTSRVSNDERKYSCGGGLYLYLDKGVDQTHFLLTDSLSPSNNVSSLLQFELNCNPQYERHIFINAEIVNTSLVNNNTSNYSYSFRDLTGTQI